MKLASECWKYSILLSLLVLTTAFLVGPDAIYVHIPFCRRRCHYCDFPIKVIGDKESTRVTEADAYTDLLLKEIKCVLTGSVAGNGAVNGIDTIYFGGGTPSLLSNHNVKDILQCINSFIPISPMAEVTMEMDPGTFNTARLNELKSMGVNRVSMGIQSFDEKLLRLAGRAHSLQDVYQAVEDIHASTIDNFSIDLISSLPSSTADSWQHTLTEAVKSGCSHLSVYDLQIEEHTAFGKWYSPGVFPMPSEDNSAAMYAAAVQTLTCAGFEHYEISNYAKVGKRSRHNQKYWKQKPFFGFGMGATSYLDGQRVSRPKSMAEYRDYVERLTQGKSGGNLSSSQIVVPTDTSTMLEYIMLSLRTAEGLDVNNFRERYGVDCCARLVKVLSKYKETDKVVETNNETEWFLRLTDPQGFMVSNDVISSVFAALS